MFKMIANAGSQATSVQEAEKYALHYYWYFMLTTAFVFTYFADAAIDLWYHSNVEQSLSQLANNIANATPLRTSATWLNWILVRTTMTLPLQYMLQVNTFVFSCIGLKCCCCSRAGGCSFSGSCSGCPRVVWLEVAVQCHRSNSCESTVIQSSLPQHQFSKHFGIMCSLHV